MNKTIEQLTAFMKDRQECILNDETTKESTALIIYNMLTGNLHLMGINTDWSSIDHGNLSDHFKPEE